MEAYDNFIQAYPIAEDKRVHLPVMICQDGFITSHAVQNIELLEDDETEETEGEPDSSEEENDKGIYSNIIKESGYVRYSKSSNRDDSEEKDEKDNVDDEPYVIRPDLFDTLDDYESMTLTYYADGVLADMFDVPIDDPDTLVGTDFVDCFNADEVDGDVVYVRNERKKTDFEIIEDLRNYSDMMKNKMRLEEDE